MRWVGYELWDVKRISLPSDIAQRMKEPRVIALAESTEDLGGEPMHAPSVNADVHPAQLVAGRDRMAATLLRKRKKVWVHVGKDWTPADLLKAEIHENLHRRHDDKAALTKQLVDKAEKIVKAEAEILGRTSQNPGRGQPKTDRTKAREIVADASGETVAAVKKNDQRAQARESGEAGEPQAGAVAVPASPLIETFGNEIPQSVAVGLSMVLGIFDKTAALLVKAQSVIGDLAMTDYPPGVAARIKEAIHDAAARVRYERPTHLCPRCKGKSVPTTGPFCGLCQERGIVTKAAFEAAGKPRDEAPKAKQEPDPDEPEQGGCAHAYRKGGKPTGICLNCGAPGAATWSEAQHAPKGTKAPPHDPSDAGWVPHGPGSDRNHDKPAKPKKGVRVVLVGADGSESEVSDADGGA